MKRNIGNTDKAIRIVLAIVVSAIALITKIPWLLILAIIPVITVVFGFCPLYALLGITTYKPKKTPSKTPIKR